MTYRVRWQFGTYVTHFAINARDGDEAVRKARARSHRREYMSSSLPMAYEAFTIIEDESDCDDENY